MNEETTPPDAPGTDDAPRFGKSQIIAGIVTVVILIVVFAVVLPQLGDYDAAWDAVQGMETWQLLSILAATAAMVLIYALPFQAALPGLGFWQAFQVRQVSFMISNVVPAGGAFGLAVQFKYLQKYGYGAAPTTAVIGITSAWNTFVTLLLPVTSLILLALAGQASAEATGVTVVASAVVIGSIVLFALVLRDEALATKVGGWGDSAIKWLSGLLKRDITVDATAGIVNFRASIIDVVRERWLLITVANVGQQLAQFSILYLAVVALQGSWFDPIGPVEALAAFAFGRLATFVPVPPGGLGTVDALITSILVSSGLDNNSALAATMIWRAATYFPQVIIGGLTMLISGSSKPESEPAPS